MGGMAWDGMGCCAVAFAPEAADGWMDGLYDGWWDGGLDGWM